MAYATLFHNSTLAFSLTRCIVNTVEYLKERGIEIDYHAVALEYMATLFQMRKRKNDKKINDSMHGEQFVLSFVSHRGGSVTPSEISNAMGISTARIAAALNNLESKGLVTRSIDLRDRRRILVELTEEGKAKEADHRKAIISMIALVLENIGEEDTVELLRILKKIAENVPGDFCGHDHALN